MTWVSQSRVKRSQVDCQASHDLTNGRDTSELERRQEAYACSAATDEAEAGSSHAKRKGKRVHPTEFYSALTCA